MNLIQIRIYTIENKFYSLNKFYVNNNFWCVSYFYLTLNKNSIIKYEKKLNLNSQKIKPMFVVTLLTTDS